jgi:hypothetical protein
MPASRTEPAWQGAVGYLARLAMFALITLQVVEEMSSQWRRLRGAGARWWGRVERREEALGLAAELRWLEHVMERSRGRGAVQEQRSGT